MLDPDRSCGPLFDLPDFFQRGRREGGNLDRLPHSDGDRSWNEAPSFSVVSSQSKFIRSSRTSLMPSRLYKMALDPDP